MLWVQIDTGDEDDESESSDSESDETLDLSKIDEMRLVPSDPNQCMVISWIQYIIAICLYRINVLCVFLLC